MQSTITESHNQEPLASAELSLRGAGGQDVCHSENKPWLICARSKGRESRASSVGRWGRGRAGKVAFTSDRQALLSGEALIQSHDPQAVCAEEAQRTGKSAPREELSLAAGWRGLR